MRSNGVRRRTLSFTRKAFGKAIGRKDTDRLWQQPLWGGSNYSNIVIEDGNVISGTVTNPASCCNGDYQTQGFQGATKRKTDTYQFAVGGRYDAGPLRITADLARTDSTFKLRAESVDYGINNENFTVNWFTGRPGGDGPTLEVVGLDFSDPANYNYRGFFERYLVADGDDWQARLDAEYEPGLSWLPNIQAGVRYTDRDAGRSDGERYWNANNRGQFNILISQVPLDYSLFQSAFRGDDNRPNSDHLARAVLQQRVGQPERPSAIQRRPGHPARWQSEPVAEQRRWPAGAGTDARLQHQ